MATIRRRNGKFQVQIRRQGQHTISKTFYRHQDAKAWGRQTETRLDKSEVVQDTVILKQLTLTELVERYIREVVPRKKSAEIEEIVLRAFMRHPICDLSLSQVTTAEFAKYRDQRLKEITPKSLKRILSPIQNMFQIAIEEWEIPLPSNPLANLRLRVIDNKRNRRLREGEFERLVLATRTRRNQHIERVVIFAIETAMRRGEILALRWDEIDLKRRCATVLESKNGHSRAIPLTPKAYALLDGIEDRKGNVFPITSDAIKMAWGRILDVAEIEDLHFHDLRHEAVSRFFEMGLTVPEVAAISGHKDIRMLMRYAHSKSELIIQKLK